MVPQSQIDEQLAVLNAGGVDTGGHAFFAESARERQKWSNEWPHGSVEGSASVDRQMAQVAKAGGEGEDSGDAMMERGVGDEGEEVTGREPRRHVYRLEGEV